MITRFNHLRTM